MKSQTLIPFRSVDKLTKTPSRSDAPHTTSSLSPRVELPDELWLVVFHLLGHRTVLFKTFRLVCRRWATLALVPLFNTAYLDSYVTSWTSLQNLCESQYAHLVKKVQWDALELPYSCLGADVWLETYPNLLKGATHNQLLELFAAFCLTHKKIARSRPPDASTVQKLAAATRKLTNCRELVLSDFLDFETSCRNDPQQEFLHSNPSLCHGAGIWARAPSVEWQYHWPEDNYDRTDAGWTILSLSKSFPSLEILSLRLWHMNTDILCRRRLVHLPMAKFRVLQCHLKTCLPKPCRAIRDSLRGDVNDSFSFAPLLQTQRSLLDVQEISLNVVYTEPDLRFISRIDHQRVWANGEYDYQLDEVENGLTYDSNADDTQSSKSSVITRWAQVEKCLLGPLPFSPALAATYHANVRFSDLVPRNLRNLSFSNVSIDLRVLIFWLAESFKVSRPFLRLNFSKCVILYGMRKSQFLATLAALDIDLTYDRDATFHLFQPHHSYIGWGEHSDDPSRVYHGEHSPQFTLRTAGRADLFSLALNESPTLLGDPDTADNLMPGPITDVNFQHRPGDYKELFKFQIPQLHHMDTSFQYLYCCFVLLRVDKQGNEICCLNYEWVPKMSYPKLCSPIVGNGYCVSILMECRIQRPPPPPNPRFWG